MNAAPIVLPRPDPLTVLVPAWGAFWGVVGAATLGALRPATTAGVPLWGVYAFFIGLALTSLWVLGSMWLRRIGWLIGGWVALGSWSSIYIGWAIQALGLLRPMVVVSWLFVVCVASFWQALRLNAVLSRKG